MTKYVPAANWFMLRVRPGARDQIQDRLARLSVPTYQPTRRFYRAPSASAKAKGERRKVAHAPVFSTTVFVRADLNDDILRILRGWKYAGLLQKGFLIGVSGRPIVLPDGEMNAFRNYMTAAKFGERRPDSEIIGVDGRYNAPTARRHNSRAFVQPKGTFDYPEDENFIPDNAREAMLAGREFSAGDVVEFRPGFGPPAVRFKVSRTERRRDGWYALGEINILGGEVSANSKISGLQAVRDE